MRNRSHRQEVKTIAEYITAETIIPPYLPYPRFLLKMDLSQTAKLLYALLLDRSTLSQKNGWTDDEGRVYIVYPIAEIAEILDKSRTTIQDTLNELAAVGLTQEAESEDYTGEDGLLYCGSCRQPKEAYFTEGKSLFGRDRHPKECDCQRKRREKQEAADREQKHREEVARLKRKGFTNPAMLEWTFENDNGKCPQMDKALFYAANWEEMKAENIGYLLWGGSF